MGYRCKIRCHTVSGCLGRDSWRGPPVEVCPGFELIAIENAAALGHDSLELSKSREAQMIRHMRHGSPPRLMALQPILNPNRRESLLTPSAGDRMTRHERRRLSPSARISCWY